MKRTPALVSLEDARRYDHNAVVGDLYTRGIRDERGAIVIPGPVRVVRRVPEEAR